MKKSKLLKIVNKILKLTISIIVVAFIYNLFISIRVYSNNEDYIVGMLNDSNYSSKYSYDIIQKFINRIYEIDLSKPTTLLRNVFDYDIQFDEVYNPDELDEESQYVSDPNPVKIEEPIVYIYNSHQLENYDSSNYEAYNITPNVMMASYMLKEKLNALGIPTIVEESDITEFIRINNWSYDYSYLASRYFINAAKEEHPTIKYFIDLHRDSIKKNYSTTTIQNNNYAKVLFVVGLEHNNYKYNLELANYINNKIKLNYPSLSRGVLTKQGANVNGIYNQDISPNSILIELGGLENKIEEVYNTIEILSQILKETINEKEQLQNT